MLIKFIDEKKENWQDYLDTCVYVKNTSKHESTKYSPFEVMFGRVSILPVDFTGARDCEEELSDKGDNDDDDVLEAMEEDRRSRLETVRKNILAAQEAQKKEYDRKHHNPEVFKLGSLVLKKDFTRKKRAGGKLDHKWLGPYRITLSLVSPSRCQ